MKLTNPLSTVEWMEKNECLDELLDHEDDLTVQSMNQGFEAEVVRISSPRESFVLKIWNKGSTPDVQFQYRLLRVLAERGLSVSKPAGWGIQPNGDKAMLTTFDGTPIQELNDKKMTELAKVLSGIHHTGIDGTDHFQLPKYDFIDYFFPGIREHSDLYEALVPLVRKASIKQDRVIHGDFHLANIVEDVDRYTVIDWTNGQRGDSRYDFAWSLTLCRIYVSERFAKVFRSAYLIEHPIERSDLDIFEAIACLRWALLNRSGGVPKGPDTLNRVKKLIAGNPILSESEFKDLSAKKKRRDDAGRP